MSILPVVFDIFTSMFRLYTSFFNTHYSKTILTIFNGKIDDRKHLFGAPVTTKWYCIRIYFFR